MPQVYVDENGEIRHSEEIKDIIAAPPSWLLNWGNTSILVFLVVLLSISAVVRYPDIIRTTMKITTINGPKNVVSRLPGRLEKVLVKDRQLVEAGQAMAYLESTAKHEQVLRLLDRLIILQRRSAIQQKLDITLVNDDLSNDLGELQAAFQAFTQNFISYQLPINNGTWEKRKNFLLEDLKNVARQRQQLLVQKRIYQRDALIASDEYEMNRRLLAEQAETPAEFREAESRYLSKRAPLIQNGSAVITADGSRSAKQKELLELQTQMQDEKAKFDQALNSLISQAKEWKSKYVITAPESGRVTFAGNIQQNQEIQGGQEIFYIDPGNNSYYGEMAIPQVNMGKVKKEQVVLIKMRSFPFEEFGILRGIIGQVNDVPYRDSVFFSNVEIDLKRTRLKRKIDLKQGMIADAEIVTEDATILERIFRSAIKVLSTD